MLKGHSLIGLRVIGHSDGKELGVVKDLVFDHDSDQILALLLSDRDLFGLIDAQIVPWEHIEIIGEDAIIVDSAQARIKAGNDPQVSRILHRETALTGTKMFTADGKFLGTLGDVVFDQKSGRIEGYEVSSGLVKDTVSGKRFIPASEEVQIGQDVAFAPPQAGEPVSDAENGATLQGATAVASQKVSSLYQEIAQASVEKQKEFVTGKTAARDVILPVDAATETTPESVTHEPEEIATIESGKMRPAAASELLNPAQVEVTDIAGDGEVVAGEVIARRGEIVTREQAERAAAAGVLHQLVMATVGGVAEHGMATAGDWTAEMQQKAEQAVIGQKANYSVQADDGSLIVARGETITEEVMRQAGQHARKNAVIGAAGLGAASQKAQDMGEALTKSATHLWDTLKQKTEGLSRVAEEKKRELDAEALQERIKRVLGRPTIRVVLDPDDNVILNSGEVITNKAVQRARETGVLDILLESAYMGMPDIKLEPLQADPMRPADERTPPESTQAVVNGAGGVDEQVTDNRVL